MSATEEPQMIGALDVEALSSRLRSRRDSTGQSIRQAASDAGVSFMTFSRVESGSQPDLSTFLKLCSWMRVNPDLFFLTGTHRHADTPEEVAAHLATDPRLEPEAAQKIASVVRDMYEALAVKAVPGAVPIACHLRAASVLRPGVADRLAVVLGDMQSELTNRHRAGEL